METPLMEMTEEELYDLFYSTRQGEAAKIEIFRRLLERTAKTVELLEALTKLVKS